jgi:hypothetical protein
MRRSGEWAGTGPSTLSRARVARRVDIIALRSPFCSAKSVESPLGVTAIALHAQVTTLHSNVQ